ncbi:MAG: class I SAM-dependent methyltransferase [Betaproteobacteria bacterium]
MMAGQIRYDDGAAYERMMGKWSQLAGAIFLDWLSLPSGRRWLDVGCGNGAFTEMVIARCAPAEIQGIDPSEAQIAFARTRAAARMADFRLGDAMALPYADDVFDIAVMALVIFFVPVPAQGVAEMVRVVRPGGAIAAYAWDILGGGWPMEAMATEMRALGVTPLLPPSVEASTLNAMRALWTSAGLAAVETTAITVHRTFADFDDLWATSCMAPTVAPKIAAMAPDDVDLLKTGLRARLPADASGRITYSARANAVKGRVPA